MDANYPPTDCWPEAPWGGGGGGGGGGWGGGALEGGFREGRIGGGGLGGALGGGSGRVRFGGGGALGGSVGRGAQAPLTSPCPPSNHTITINLTLTFAASWFGHASHVDWAE